MQTERRDTSSQAWARTEEVAEPIIVSVGSGQPLAGDVRWRFGKPPNGIADYAWIQHLIRRLTLPNGRGGVAGFVMANGSLSSNSGGDGEIPRRIVGADLVDSIVAISGDRTDLSAGQTAEDCVLRSM